MRRLHASTGASGYSTTTTDSITPDVGGGFGGRAIGDRAAPSSRPVVSGIKANARARSASFSCSTGGCRFERVRQLPQLCETEDSPRDRGEHHPWTTTQVAISK